MHDLGYAYVEIRPLIWTPELIESVKADIGRGLKILTSRKWVPDPKLKVGGKWVACKPIDLED